MKKLLCFLTGAFALAGVAETYFWTASTAQRVWGDWGTAANWAIGSATGSAATQAPGATDVIGYPQEQLWANLGGQEWSIKTYDQDATPHIVACLGLTNGTLTVLNTYEAYTATHYLYDGATFIIAPTVANMYEARWNASYVEWWLNAGSRLEIRPQIVNYFQAYYNVLAGATLRLEAQKYSILGSPWPNIYRNWGTMIVTNGWDFAGNSVTVGVDNSTNKSLKARARDGNWAYMALDQLGGTIQLGGAFSSGPVTDMPFYFSVGGGTLDVVRDTTFTGFTCTVSNDAQVTVNVAAGAQIDLSPFTYGTGSAFTKTGAGMLVLGAHQPDALAVDAGTLEVTSTETDFTKLSLVADTTLMIGVAELRLDALDGYGALHFAVDTNRLNSGSVFFRSTDAALRLRVQSEVQTYLGTAYDIVAVGDGLLCSTHCDHVFDATKGVALTEPAGWTDATVPAQGAEVVIRGAGTAVWNADVPAFKSVTLELGACLETAGGTAAAPLVVPALNLNYSATFRVAADSYAVVTNGVAAYASATSLPIFEIATNGVAFVQDAAYPARGIYFKNLDVRLYGRLEVPKATSSGSYVASQMFFGYAEPGETTYMAFTADGGTIYAPHVAAAYFGNRSLVSIASPAVNGRVKVVREVLFRNYRKIADLTSNSLDGNTANSGYAIGLNNPSDEVFDVCVDNSNLAPQGPTWFAGGSRTRFVNGGQCARPGDSNSHSYGHTRGVWVQDAATLSFDGGLFQLDHPCGSSDLGKGLAVNPTAALAALTLGGGARFVLWEQYGNGKATCSVTDGTFCVPRLNPPRMERNSTTGVWSFMNTWTQTNTPAFSGFASVAVPQGGVLRFDACDVNDIRGCNERYKGGTADEDNPYNATWYADWWEWHRKTALLVPVTGAGDVVVTNTLAGVDPRAGKWFTPAGTVFADLSVWSMNLVLRGGSNTCVGAISAATNVNAFLHLADGANWAGTLRANAHVKFGDPILADAGETAAPATVCVNDLALEGPLTLRLWKDATTQTNDFLEIAGTASGTARTAGLAGEGMAGYTPQVGEWFTVARCAKTATPPKAARGWRVKVVDDPDDDTKSLVCLTSNVLGTTILLR